MLCIEAAFDMSGAIEARRVIEDSFDFAVFMWGNELHRANNERSRYWVERVSHLLKERATIDEIVKKLGAGV